MAGVAIDVETVIDAPPAMVWADVRDLASHTEWMHDAVAIRFTTARTSGPGTRFDCDTKVGPFRTVDRMTVTEWSEGHSIGIRHEGLVTGEGRFTLEDAPGGRTRFRWSERLQFPWWLGGDLTGRAARPVLRWIWRRNLAGLAARF